MSVHFPTTHRRYMHYRKKDDFIVIKYGAEWCGPCKSIKPLIAELAKQYPTVYFLDVDVDNEVKDYEEIPMIDHSDFENIKTIPHFKFFVKGELIREFHGSDAERLKTYVKRYSQNNLNEINNINEINNDKVKNDEVENIEELVGTNSN